MNALYPRRLAAPIAHSIAAALLCAVALADAQPTAVQQNAVRQACRSDYMAHCSGVTPGGAEALACLQQHAAESSAGCQRALAAIKSASAAKAAPTPQAASMQAPMPSSAQSWPQTVSVERGTAVIYQPQVVSWPDRRTLDTRIAVAITPTGAKSPMLGAIEVSFATNSDLETRTVTLSSPKLVSASFPTSEPLQKARIDEGIKSALDTMPDKRVPLDTILLSLNRQAETPPQTAVNNNPPAIFYSARPASLLVFDGEPVLAPVAATSLSVVVNTNWDVFVDNGTKTWYWLNNGAWLTAPDFKGTWSPVTTLPAAFSQLPSDTNFAAVRKQIPGKNLPASQMPAIFVSTQPAEILVNEGTPKLVAIAGTSLKYVSNTDVPLFVDGSSGRYYYLIAGRWFSATSLDGQWTFATTSLPSDFAKIPPSSPRGSVLVSVPGTPQAQEAVLQSQIPTEAAL